MAARPVPEPPVPAAPPRMPRDPAPADRLAGDPHPTLARLRRTAPVCWLPALDGWLVTSRAAVLAVLDDPVTFTVDDPRFSTAAVVGPSLLSLDGAEHARHRRAFAAGFRPALVEGRYADDVRRLAADLVAGFRGRGTAEVRTELAGPLAVGTVTRILGLTGVEAGTVLGWYAAIVGSVTAVSAGRPPTAEGTAATAELRRAVLRTLERSRSAPDDAPDDAPDGGSGAGLLAAAAGPPAALTADEVAADAAVLMFGGIETVEGMVANAVLHLLDLPGGPPAGADPAWLAGAVEESLRLEPAASRVDRYTTRDTVLAGVAIPAGDLVIASLAAANRDPATFPDPDRFDPARPQARLQLAFARGPHVCPAAQLARRQTEIALAALLALPGLRLDRAATGAPRGLVFRKPERVVIRWDAGPT
jgi:cytochrome P450